MASSRKPEVRSFSRRMREKLDDFAELLEHGTTTPYPLIAAALKQLQHAVDTELKTVRRTALPTRPRDNRGLKRPWNLGPTRKYYQRSLRMKKENDKLREQLASQSAAKGKGTLLTPEWMTRVFLSSPSMNARGLARSFREVAGTDGNNVGRRSIGRVRDAFIELYKPMVMKVAAERVVGAVAAAKHIRACFAPLYMLWIQDEADLCLRSGEDHDIAIPRRSRASKVQQYVVELSTNSGSLEIPTELEALGDKKAATLATSFERLLRSIAADVLPAPGGIDQPWATAPEIWFFHIIVGDGISTNEAAAKQLWACLQEQGLGARVRYFLSVIVCGTHQVGLAARSAVEGRAAATARGLLHLEISGVAVRLFKYLINDYYDEFVFSVHEWVLRDLVVLSASDVDATGQTSPPRLTSQT